MSIGFASFKDPKLPSFFIILFQNILIYTFLNNTYYMHLLFILRERERKKERGFIQYFSFLITLRIFNCLLCLGYLFGLVLNLHMFL